MPGQLRRNALSYEFALGLFVTPVDFIRAFLQPFGKAVHAFTIGRDGRREPGRRVDFRQEPLYGAE